MSSTRCCAHGGPPIGSEAYEARRLVAETVVARMASTTEKEGASIGALSAPPVDYLRSHADVVDSLLVKLMWAQATEYVLRDQPDDAFVEWEMAAIFVQSFLLKDPSHTSRVTSEIMSEGAAVKYCSKQVPCKCLRPLLKTKFKYDVKAGFCFYCKKEQADASKLLRCSRCKICNYCSTQCQKADWKDHKQICNVLAAGSQATERKKSLAAERVG
jgi:hypothetical protein